MNRSVPLVVSALLALGALALSPALGADDPVLKYRGAGKSRDALDAMQLKPYDNGLWANLSNWNGAAPKPEDLSGKVVLIVTWASWHKLSHPAMRSAQTLHEKYKDKGLVVLGVHNPQGFEGAAENATALAITFPFAEDKAGKFRTALKADQDPNIYLVDRSGNLRFAQIDTSSMEDGAAQLVKETAEQAADYPKALAKRTSDTDKKRWLTKDTTGLAPGEEASTVVFAEPDDDAYKATRWPYMVGKVENDPILDKIKHEAPKILNFPEEDWVPSTPKRAGKMLVIYFFDPKEVEMLNVIPSMNRLHDEYRRDAVIVGSTFKLGSNSLTGTDSGGATEEDEKLKQRNKDFIATILRTRSVNHFLNPNKIRAENLELGGGGMVPRISPSKEEFGICIILSTDMRIRWIGSPYDQDLRIALDKLIAVDPAVKARRKAEDAKKK